MFESAERETAQLPAALVPLETGPALGEAFPAEASIPESEAPLTPGAPLLGPTRAFGLLGGFYLSQFVAASVVGAVAGLSFALQRAELGATGGSQLIGIVGPLGSLVGFGFAGMRGTDTERTFEKLGDGTAGFSGFKVASVDSDGFRGAVPEG